AGGQRRRHLLHLVLHTLDHVQRILAVSHHDEAAYYFTLPNRSIRVRYREISDAAADLGPELHGRDVGDSDGNAARSGADRDGADVIERFEAALALHDVFGAAHLEHTSAHILVRCPHGADHALDG